MGFEVVRGETWAGLGARPLLFPAVFLATGAGVGTAFGVAPGPGWAAALACCSGACLLASLWLRQRPGAHLCLLLGMLGAGAALSTFDARRTMPAALEGARVRVEGVLEEVFERPDGCSLGIAVSRVLDPAPAEVRFRVRLRSDRPCQLESGQRVLVPTRLRPPSPPSNPGERRFTSFADLVGAFEASRLVALTAPSRWQVWRRASHAEFARRVRAVAPNDEAALLYLALAAGARAELSPETEEIFARSGLVHVLSISGFHVTALAMFAFWLFKRFLATWSLGTRLGSPGQLAAASVVPLVWLYVAYTGAEVPAVRSGIMATAHLAGLAIRRQGDALNHLALAVLILVVTDPTALTSLSAQLSFSCMGALLLLAPSVRGLLPELPSKRLRGSRWWRLVDVALSTVAASAAATVASLPLVAGAFGRVSLTGLVANVATLPVGFLLTILGAAGAATNVLLPNGAEVVAWAGTRCAALFLQLAALFSSWPGSALPLRPFGPWAAMGFAIGLVAFSVLRGRARLLALTAPACLLLTQLVPFVLDRRAPLEVTFLAVGHGDATVVSSQDHHALIDGGGVPHGMDTGARFVRPFLEHQRISRLDLAVLSHPHPDHALGLASTLAHTPTERLWLAAGTGEGELSAKVRAAAGGAQVEEVERGRTHQLGEARLAVLGPPPDRKLLEGVNDRSLVLMVAHGEVTFLLTGDIEAAGEEALSVGRVTVAKAPHHGSRTSSSPGFVDATRPRYVVFCVGRNNRFRFPHPEVVERYRAAGTRCFRTDHHGAIRFRSDGRDVSVDTFLPSLEDEPPEPGQVMEVVHEER